MSEIKFIMVLGGQEKTDVGYCISSIIFVIFHSTPVTAWLLSCSDKEKKKFGLFFFSSVEVLQLLDRCSYSLCAKKLTGLQAAQTDQRSPPAMRTQTQRQGFSSVRPETNSNSPSCLWATSPGCLQSKSNLIWLQAKLRKLDYLSPPIRWELEGWGEREGRSEKLTQALKMLWNCNMHLQPAPWSSSPYII